VKDFTASWYVSWIISRWTKLICQWRSFQLTEVVFFQLSRYSYTSAIPPVLRFCDVISFFRARGLIWRTRVLLVHWQNRGGSLRNFTKHVASGANPRDGTFAGAAELPWDVGWNKTTRQSDAAARLPPFSVANGRPRLATASAWRSRTDTRVRATGGEKSLSPLFLSLFLFSSAQSRRQRRRSVDAFVVRIIAPRPLSPQSPFWPLRLSSVVSQVHPVHWYFRRQWWIKRTRRPRERQGWKDMFAGF